MNKMILLAAVISMAAPSAFASKARLAALSNAAHLVDTQTIFTNPGDIGLLGDFATFEFGTTAGSNSHDYRSTTTPADKTAEGGFLRSNGDAKWGFYLGHKSETIQRTRAVGAALGATGMLSEQNPIELFYGMKGDLNWGASVFYSNSDQKTTGMKQNSSGVRFGARTTAWDAYINVGIGADAKNSDGREVKNDLGAKIGGGYYFDTLYVYGNYGMQNATVNTAAAETGKLEGSELNVGVLDTKKQDGADFFYGISYGMYHLKNKDGNGNPTVDNSYLPVLVGIEADAASWLTVRASLQQNVLLGGHKYDNGSGTGSDLDTWNNSTVVAAGLGAKWNKFIIDGTLQAAANGGSMGFDGNNFLGTGSITYMF